MDELRSKNKIRDKREKQSDDDGKESDPKSDFPKTLFRKTEQALLLAF